MYVTDYSVITKEFSRSCTVEVDLICVICVCLIHYLAIDQTQILKIFKYSYTHIYFLLY